jgi:hypothetical protein
MILLGLHTIELHICRFYQVHVKATGHPKVIMYMYIDKFTVLKRKLKKILGIDASLLFIFVNSKDNGVKIDKSHPY